MRSRPIDQHSFWLLFLKSPFQTQTGFSSLLRSPAPWMSILTHCQRYLLMIRKWLFPPALSSELHTWTPEWPPGLLHWNVPPNSHFEISHPPSHLTDPARPPLDSGSVDGPVVHSASHAKHPGVPLTTPRPSRSVCSGFLPAPAPVHVGPSCCCSLT